MNHNPRRGSPLDSFLDEEGVLAEFRTKAIEEIVAWRRAKPARKILRFPKDG